MIPGDEQSRFESIELMLHFAIRFQKRKFREVDEEESYFDCDDDDEEGMNGEDQSQSSNAATDIENDLHRIPRMFSLSDQASQLDSHAATDSGGQEEDGDKVDWDDRQAAKTDKGTNIGGEANR